MQQHVPMAKQPTPGVQAHGTHQQLGTRQHQAHPYPATMQTSSVAQGMGAPSVSSQAAGTLPPGVQAGRSVSTHTHTCLPACLVCEQVAPWSTQLMCNVYWICFVYAVAYHGQHVGPSLQAAPAGVPAGLTPVHLPPGVTALNPHHPHNLPASGLSPGVVLLNPTASVNVQQQQQQQHLMTQSISGGGAMITPQSAVGQQPSAAANAPIPGVTVGKSASTCI